MYKPLLKISLLALALTASSSAFAVSKKVLDQRLQVVEAQQGELQARVGKLERGSSTQVMMELLQKVEQLQADNAELRGQLEEQQNEVERLRKRQRDLYLDTDRRLNEIQMSGATAPPAAELSAAAVAAQPASAGAVQPAAAQPAASVDPAQEREEYERAFNALREGRHSDAIAAFQRYLGKYPQGRFAHNAQYWIGEANYVTHNFDQALQDFQQVLKNYPNSNKVADASLKLGYTYYELKNYAEARKALAAVVKQYPSSKAAGLAEKRLLSMGQEGL